ncbi:MAG: TonB family protein [Betaproteobacteria bacterium]
MAADSPNRTLVLSVVAVDLVGYSRKSVAEQMSLKEDFNRVLLEAIADIAVADRIILDTGDGVAMGFLGDPEDALFVAMYMHDAINRDSSGSPSGSMDSGAIRIGINLGPVKLATGAGGHPNIIGDGINVAERIMGFADPGQLTASHAVYEVMSRMSDHYATLFQYLGVHTDKQVRSHDVYMIGKSPAAFRQAQRGVAERAAARVGKSPGAQHTPSVTHHPAAPALNSGRHSRTGPNTVDPSMAAALHAVPAASAAPWPEAAAAEGAGNAHPGALIDFLEDRNKVATTATMLVIIAVVLAALLVYRKMQLSYSPVDAAAIAAAPAQVALAPTETPPASAPVIAPASAPPPAAVPVVPAPVAAKTVPPPVAMKTAPETKATPSHPAPQSAPPPAVSASPTKSPAPSTAPVVVPPVKTPERPAPSAANEANAAAAAADKAKDSRNDKNDRPAKNERIEKSDRPARPDPPSRNPSRNAPPVVPAFQSPVEAPKPEVVAPTPAPVPPPVPVVDTRVIRLSRTEPAYPLEAVRQSIPSGYVRARVTIDANGNVSDVAILESRPISAFGRETRMTVQQWKYNPGAPGRTQEIELSFKP